MRQIYMSQTKNNQSIENTPSISILKTATSPKLNPKAQSKLEYQVGILDDTDEIYIRISNNESGGYFSKEWIPIERIESCFDNSFNRKTPFRSSLFNKAFQHGRSANNSGFLAAILRQEAVLSIDNKNIFQHLLSGNFTKWREKIIKLKTKS